MRYTVTALTGRAMLDRLVKGMFMPRQIPPGFFSVLSREMMLRPVQLRANAEDAAFMMPQARSLSRRYGELRLPVTLIAGAHDKVVDLEAHSRRLHRELAQSRLHVATRAGHMAHYHAADEILAALDRPTQDLLPEVGATPSGQQLPEQARSSVS